MLHIFLVVSMSVGPNQLSVDDTNSKAHKTKSLVGFWAVWVREHYKTWCVELVCVYMDANLICFSVTEGGVTLLEAGYEYLIQNTELYL